MTEPVAPFAKLLCAALAAGADAITKALQSTQADFALTPAPADEDIDDWDDAPTTPDCRTIDVDGEAVRIQGSGDLDEETSDALHAVVRAARRRMREERRAERERVAQADAALRRAHDLVKRWGSRTDQLRVAADHLRIALEGTDGDDGQEQGAPVDRAAVLREAIDVARTEGHRLEAEASIEAARGARSVTYLLCKLLTESQEHQDVQRALRRGEFWSLLDWSLWGSGMGDTFREPLADTMVAALTPEQLRQAEELMQAWHDSGRQSLGRHRYEELAAERKAAMDRAEQAEAERDGAYRERAQLLAWLASHGPAVIAPSPDVDEPGWQLLYISAGRQLSWHIAPRDADLFLHVEQVTADDPRAQWDGHTTEEKYEHIRRLANPARHVCTCTYGQRCLKCQAEAADA